MKLFGDSNHGNAQYVFPSVNLISYMFFFLWNCVMKLSVSSSHGYTYVAKYMAWNLLHKFIVIYLDDITVLSKISEEHILHLKLTFEKLGDMDYLWIPRNLSFP